MPRIVVDGIEYSPFGWQAKPSVGVAITTHNRPDVLAATLAAFERFSPQIPVVIVDDGSNRPVKSQFATVVRNQPAMGIAAAKNRCLVELMRLGVEHLFLFDDDTRPACEAWWQPYVDSAEPHLQYSWLTFTDGRPVEKMKSLYRGSDIAAYTWSMGCMLYAHRSVVDRVGGMRTEFGVAMHEHIEWSQRIHNAGLTTFIHQDVANSEALIEASDRGKQIASSIQLNDRRQQLVRNDQILQSYRDDATYVPVGHRDAVLTCLFTSQVDPQRGICMAPDPVQADNLLKSLTGEAVVLCDFATDRSNFERVETTEVAYLQRWISYRKWLIEHPEVRFLWCVDATDVEQLREPFADMQPGVLYCGWENTVIGCSWMLDNHAASRLWIEANLNEPLLNAGVVGGDRATMLTFIGRLLRVWSEAKMMGGHDKAGDMAYFNRAAHSMSPVSGPQITTLFKGDERNNWSLWKHK
jgi:glycosyltransferase involved in cell wall biosynthesis